MVFTVLLNFGGYCVVGADCLVRYRMFNNIPGLSSLDASSTVFPGPIVRTKNVSTMAECFLGDRNTPDSEPWC